MDAGAAPDSATRAGTGDGRGIVAYITVAGFLGGPGFQAMRAYLRRRCDEVFVIDCTPEGHQPEGATRIFQGVQQPVCIVLASRWRARPADGATDDGALATVRWRSLPAGPRQQKFDALAQLRLDDDGWQVCPAEERAPFFPAAVGAWADYPALGDFFVYDGSGVMPGRTWVIAPDQDSLTRRWSWLTHAPAAEKAALFHPHLVAGKPGDKHVDRVPSTPLPGFALPAKSVAEEGVSVPPVVRYGFRSFDRQWIVPDIRVINRPNPKLWEV